MDSFDSDFDHKEDAQGEGKDEEKKGFEEDKRLEKEERKKK